MHSALNVGDIYFAGIAADVAGAVVLAMGFSFKRPERMREEVPQLVQAPTTPGSVGLPFPQGQLESMVMQRAEARCGMGFLVVGFALQAISYLVGTPWELTRTSTKLVAMGCAVAVWMVAWLAYKAYVPTAAWMTMRRVPSGMMGPVRLYDERHLEVRKGVQVDISDSAEPPLAARLLHRLGLLDL